MKIFSGAKFKLGKDWGFWFRIFGYGIAVSTLKPVFSERNGYTKIIKIGRVKIKLLKPSLQMGG